MRAEEEQPASSAEPSPRPSDETTPAQSEEESLEGSGKEDTKHWWQDPLLVAAAVAVSVTLTVLAGIAITAWTLHWDGFWRGMGQPYATTLAALAAVSAGAIALHNHRSQLSELREQRKLEQDRWEHQRNQDLVQREEDQARWAYQKTREEVKDLRARFSEITTQLADERATSRRSAAYAMIALANDWHNLGEDSETKVCVGVLTAYLTSPNLSYSDDPKPDAGEDGAVRALIVALLSNSAGLELKDLWGNSNLLAGADLRGVTFTAPVNRVNFSEADLTGATFSNRNVRKVGFTSANLTSARLSFLNLEEADLSFARLIEANLFNTSLKNADLTYADLRGASFDWADLTGATLLRANLCGADLSGCELEGVDLHRIRYDEKTRWPGGFTPPPQQPG